jgi:hypothetical protein
MRWAKAGAAATRAAAATSDVATAIDNLRIMDCLSYFSV